MPLFGFFGKVVMEDLKVVLIDNRRVAGSLMPNEVVGCFTFPTFPLSNPTIIDYFKQERKAQTYIRVHHRTFGLTLHTTK